MTSLKIIPGKDVTNDPKNPNDTTDLNFANQDDASIAGAGMPVTIALCRKIVHDYHQKQEDILKELDKLPSTAQLDELKKSISSKDQHVSGIYGRDTILHILEQEGCEGIMYVNGLYGDKETIVLIGVDKIGNPIGGQAQFQTDARPAVDAVIYEVRGGGKTRDEILVIMPV